MSSEPMLPSVPGVSGRRCPSSSPNETPSAPGNVPNRLSNVRFSLIRNTTCLIGQRVLPPVTITPGEGEAEAPGSGEAGLAGAADDGADGADPPSHPPASMSSASTGPA